MASPVPKGSGYFCKGANQTKRSAIGGPHSNTPSYETKDEWTAVEKKERSNNSNRADNPSRLRRTGRWRRNQTGWWRTRQTATATCDSSKQSSNDSGRENSRKQEGKRHSTSARDSTSVGSGKAVSSGLWVSVVAESNKEIKEKQRKELTEESSRVREASQRSRRSLPTATKSNKKDMKSYLQGMWESDSKENEEEETVESKPDKTAVKQEEAAKVLTEAASEAPSVLQSTQKSDKKALRGIALLEAGEALKSRMASVYVGLRQLVRSGRVQTKDTSQVRVIWEEGRQESATPAVRLFPPADEKSAGKEETVTTFIKFTVTEESKKEKKETKEVPPPKVPFVAARMVGATIGSVGW